MTYRRLTTVPMRKAPNVSSRVGGFEGGPGKASGIALEDGIIETSSTREDKARNKQGEWYLNEEYPRGQQIDRRRRRGNESTKTN